MTTPPRPSTSPGPGPDRPRRPLPGLLLALALLACGPTAPPPGPAAPPTTPSAPPATLRPLPPGALGPRTSEVPPVPLADLPLGEDESATPVPGGQGERQLLSYLSPDRQASTQGQRVVAALKIPRGARVVDVGAGSGYFSVLLARAVEPQGRVLALDQDPYAIWFLRRRLAGDPALARLPIQVTRARPEDPGLKPGSVDLVFMSEIHVFLERDPWVADWLEKLAAALAPGGRLAVLEHRQRPDGRPVSREDMIEAFRRGGLELVREHDVIPEEHLMELRPAR